MPVLLAGGGGGGGLGGGLPDGGLFRPSFFFFPMVLVGDFHWNGGTFPSKKSSTGNSAESMMRP